MFKIKFGMMPGHWGLAGKTRERAQAEYELKGFALAERLLDIDKDQYTNKEYASKYFDLQLKFGKLTESQYRRSIAGLIEDETQRALANLELDHRDGKITDREYAKGAATLNKEPWVDVLNMDFTKKTSLEGSFELDWNEFFVEKLKSEGYLGATPDIIVNSWFMEVCRNVALEEFDGTGDFTADSEANLESMKRWQSESKSYPGGRKGYK